MRGCGFSQDSINAIRSTTVITRDGMQHVVPDSQAHLDEAPQNPTTQGATTADHLQDQVKDHQRMFARFKQFTDKKIMDLESQLNTALEQIKDMQQTILTLKSNQAAQATAAAPTKKEAAPADKAVDRNNVAPADVQVESIFYCGQR